MDANIKFVKYHSNLKCIAYSNNQIRFSKIYGDFFLDTEINDYDYFQLNEPTSVENVPKKVLEFLAKNSLLVYMNKGRIGAMPDSVKAYLSNFLTEQADLDVAHAKFLSSKVSLINLSSYEWVPQFLNIEEGLKPNLVIVIIEDYFNLEAIRYSEIFFKKKQNWMVVCKKPSKIYIGPFFNQDHPGCYNCFLRRTEIHSEKFVESNEEIGDCPKTSISNLVEFMQLELQVIKWLAFDGNSELDSIFEFSPARSELEKNFFSVFPVCDVCG